MCTYRELTPALIEWRRSINSTHLFNVGWQNIVGWTYQNGRSVDTIHRLANMLLLSTSAGNMKIKMQLLLLDTLFGWNGVIVDMENPKTIKIHVQHHNMKLYKYLRQIFFTWHNRHVLWNYIVSVIPSSYLSFGWHIQLLLFFMTFQDTDTKNATSYTNWLWVLPDL